MSDYVLSDSILVFTNSTRRACGVVVLVDDQVFEDSRETLNITIAAFALSDQDLIGFASVGVTEVVIVDDDRIVVLGFVGNSSSIVVSESESAVACVGILSPEPGVDNRFSSMIRAVVGTRPGSAGEHCDKVGSSL